MLNEENKTLSNEQIKEMILRVGEKVITEQGHGIVPEPETRNLTGLRYIPIIERKLGRKITEKEWEDMSIR